MSVDIERLVAFTALLALPDPRGLHRGHKVTHRGAPDRFQKVFLHSARAWTQHRIALANGAADGWKPARTERPTWVISVGRFS